MNTERERLGALIRARRREEELTLKDMAEELGISLMTLQRIEKGQTPPSFFTVVNIARILGLSIEELMSIVEPSLHILRKGSQKQISLGPLLGREVFPEGVIADKISVRIKEGKKGDSASHIQYDGIIASFHIKGKGRLQYLGKNYTLNEGDAAYFDASIENSFELLEDSIIVSISIKN
jgi:transcriptional regulator with XRE-family HTH domain